MRSSTPPVTQPTQAPRASRRRRWAIVAIALLLAVVAAAAIVLSLPAFGARAAGERLARMQADPHFRDGAFVNDVLPEEAARMLRSQVDH